MKKIIKNINKDDIKNIVQNIVDIIEYLNTVKVKNIDINSYKQLFAGCMQTFELVHQYLVDINKTLKKNAASSLSIKFYTRLMKSAIEDIFEFVVKFVNIVYYISWLITWSRGVIITASASISIVTSFINSITE